MRPCIVPPADVHTHLLHWNLLQCPVQGRHVAARHVQKLRLGRHGLWLETVSSTIISISILFIPTCPPHTMSIYVRCFHLGPRIREETLEKSTESGLTEIRPLGVAAHAQVGTVHLPVQTNPSDLRRSTELMEPPVRSKHPNTFKTGNHWEPVGADHASQSADILGRGHQPTP